MDLQVAEIADLRDALSEKTEELQRTEAEKNRIASERSDVARTVATLEADLRRVKKDAEAFGRDLKLLRAEKERMEAKQKEELSKTERMMKQTQTQIRLLNEQLDGQRAKVARAKEELQNHVCAMYVSLELLSHYPTTNDLPRCSDEQQLSTMKQQHNKECKGLIIQIRYLKAKFTRESAFRSDLGYQKRYLLVLLSRFEKTCAPYSIARSSLIRVAKQRTKHLRLHCQNRIPRGFTTPKKASQNEVCSFVCRILVKGQVSRDLLKIHS